MEQIVARRAEHSDIPQLVELMRAFYAESSFRLDRDGARRAFECLIAEPVHGAVWLIECDGVPVGHIVLSLRFTMEFGGLSGYIDDLFVRPTHRRRGAARAGLEALFAECHRRGCRSIHVEVSSDNEAANVLYRRYGLVLGDDARRTLRVVWQPAG